MCTIDVAHTSPPSSPAKSVTLFVEAWDGNMIRIVTNLHDRIIELRRQIYNQLRIPIHHWRLSSCGGKLFRDRRTLAEYGLCDSATVVMRLLLRGGVSSRKRMAPGDGSTKSRHLEQLNRSTVTLPRRSERLSIKRRKKQNEENVTCQMGSSPNDTNHINTASLTEKILSDLRNSQPVLKSSSYSQSSPNQYSAHTGLSQELEDLAISHKHALQARYRSESDNANQTTFYELALGDQNTGSPKSDEHANTPGYYETDALLKQKEGHGDCSKETHIPKFGKLPENSRTNCNLSRITRKSSIKPPAFMQDFAETLLDNEWVKVEVLNRSLSTGDRYMVQRLDGHGKTFQVNANDLAPLGSNDPESDWQIWKRVEYNKLEKLLDKEGYLIEKVVEDGNCVYRAAAR